jgi:hypothetical protein
MEGSLDRIIFFQRNVNNATTHLIRRLNEMGVSRVIERIYIALTAPTNDYDRKDGSNSLLKSFLRLIVSITCGQCASHILIIMTFAGEGGKG